MKHENVSVPVGGASMPAYLSLPDGDDKRAAVIVIEEIFGVNREIRRITDLVARTGYIGLAPNFFHRTHPDLDLDYQPESLNVGRAAAGAATLEGLQADLDAAIEFVLKQPRCNGAIATWGFCFGGSVAFLSATKPDVKAAVSFYGGQIAAGGGSRPPLIEFTQDVRAPIFLSFGGKDQSITPEHVAAIEKALRDNGKRYALEVYPDEGHGYFRHGINGESTPGARDVWPKVQRFLAEHLGAPVPA